jgi:hypothetical protein
MVEPGVTHNIEAPSSSFQPIFLSRKDKHIGKRSRSKERVTLSDKSIIQNFLSSFNSKALSSQFSFLERMSIKESLVGERKE